MLKRIALALAATISLSGPAAAAPRGLDAAHASLYNTLVGNGVEVYINPSIACEDPEYKDLAGAYFYAEDERTPVLFICQDNRTGRDGVEVVWTENDLDTLRHESMHYIHDCIDGDVSFTLTPFFDGPGGAPGDATYLDIISALGMEQALEISEWYSQKMGADAHIIRLEHEAFLVARDIDAGELANTISTFCPIN